MICKFHSYHAHLYAVHVTMRRLYGVQEVRVLGNRGLVASHPFATPISLAACREGSIAVAQGSSVQMLAVDSSAGQLQPGLRNECSQQVAAVAIVELADTSSKVKAILEHVLIRLGCCMMGLATLAVLACIVTYKDHVLLHVLLTETACEISQLMG